MNCTVIQRRLLSAEQPEQPAAEIKSHLAQCPACRAWLRRLVQIERQIPLLPVPPSTAKAELLRRLLGPAPADVARPALAELPRDWRSALAPGPKERGLRKLSIAFALAASLLIFALAWWSWPHDKTVPPAVSAQRAADQDKLDRRLHKVLLTEKPRERILQVAGLLEELLDEATKMVDDAERVDQWARFCVRVVSKDLMEQARQLPPPERSTVLKEVASRLIATESKASHRVADLSHSDPKSAASFDRIALAARKGEKALRALMNA
ncbi:MAG TPA: hypothetical protein VH643_00220 [Gemmataceae bacterium]